MLFGDSKTQLGATVTWPAPLVLQAIARTSHPWQSSNAGAGGATVETTLAGIAATLAAMPAALDATDIRALINLGVNDITTGLPAEATWIANYVAILDAIHVKWPSALVYVMRPWLHGNPSPSYDTECNTLAGWIASVIAARSAFAEVGPDERVWLKGSDDGATMTIDGTHYSVAGNAECTRQWTAGLWP